MFGEMLQNRLSLDPIQPLCVSYGMGRDSTAALVAMAREFRKGRQEFRPDLITFADVGSEKGATYRYLPTIQRWLSSVGFPPVTVVKYCPDPNRCKHGHYTTLEENCLVNTTLPSLAFGGLKGCSIKWKTQPQNKYRKTFPPIAAAHAIGMKAIVMIGYDAGPKDIRRKAIKDDDKYVYWYPLRELDWDREACTKAIMSEGLKVPVKSACFFCPAVKMHELDEYAETYEGRSYLRRIIAMEDNAAHNLVKIQGLWGRGCKGVRDPSKKRPGSMSKYIKEKGLLEPRRVRR